MTQIIVYRKNVSKFLRFALQQKKFILKKEICHKIVIIYVNFVITLSQTNSFFNYLNMFVTKLASFVTNLP